MKHVNKPAEWPGTNGIATRRTLLRAATGAGAAVLLGGCSNLLPGQGPPPRLFRLSPKSTFGNNVPTVDWQLVVEVPLAPAGLETTRIALIRSAMEMEYYARANWTDRAPAMVQTLVVESFENSGKILAVGRDSLGLRADYVLKLELREFQAEYIDGAPTAHVRINGKIVQMPQRTIVGSQSFDSAIAAQADTIEGIVGAFDEALGKVLKNLVGWCLETGEAHRRSEPRRER